MKLLLFSVTVLAVYTWVLGEDKCMPPKPGEKHTRAGECCKLSQEMITDDMKSTMHDCMKKMPPPPKPPGPGSSDQPPPNFKEMKAFHDCFQECVFRGMNLLKEDNTIDESAFKTFSMSTNKDLKPVMEEATTKCLTSYKKNMDRSTNCTSGAADLTHCISRQIFLNCPATMWTSSSECSERKAIVEQCPHQPIMFFGPPPKPPH